MVDPFFFVSVIKSCIITGAPSSHGTASYCGGIEKHMVWCFSDPICSEEVIVGVLAPYRVKSI